jgi:hypothetical protein
MSVGRRGKDESSGVISIRCFIYTARPLHKLLFLLLEYYTNNK